MTKLTTERLEKKIKSCIEIENCEVMMPLSAAQELLDFRNAAKKPIAWMRNEDKNHASDTTDDSSTANEWEARGLKVTPLYAAPVLPKQPRWPAAEVERDALRYRFLRDKDFFGDEDEPGLVGWEGLVELGYNEFDAAVDARISHPNIDYVKLDTALRKHIPAQPVIPEQIEPAAWRCDKEGTKGVVITVHKQVADSWILKGWKVTPLIEANQSQPVSEPYKLPVEEPYGYFAFCQWNGEEFFNKREDAINLCKEAIEEYRKENAEEGCDPDEVRRVCWGIIMQHGTDIVVDDEGHIDYALTPELSTNSQVIPDGWKLVPIEPTAAMFHAFNDCDYGRKSMRERYIQMIEAAPAQESE